MSPYALSPTHGPSSSGRNETINQNRDVNGVTQVQRHSDGPKIASSARLSNDHSTAQRFPENDDVNPVPVGENPGYDYSEKQFEGRHEAHCSDDEPGLSDSDIVTEKLSENRILSNGKIFATRLIHNRNTKFFEGQHNAIFGRGGSGGGGGGRENNGTNGDPDTINHPPDPEELQSYYVRYDEETQANVANRVTPNGDRAMQNIRRSLENLQGEGSSQIQSVMYAEPELPCCSMICQLNLLFSLILVCVFFLVVVLHEETR